MTYRLQEHPLAEAELAEASDWYDQQRPGLGHAFLDAAFKAQDDIAGSPEMWATFPGWNGEPVVRSRHFRGFPYRAVYYIKDDDTSSDITAEASDGKETKTDVEQVIVLIAYAHEKRRPAYWAGRIVGVEPQRGTVENGIADGSTTPARGSRVPFRERPIVRVDGDPVAYAIRQRAADRFD